MSAASNRDIIAPCPFCGGTQLKSGGDDKIVGTWCLTCEATGPNEYGKFTWNQRAITAAGYRIVRDGEVDAVTVERCIEVIREGKEIPDPLDDYRSTVSRDFSDADEAIAALRALVGDAK